VHLPIQEPPHREGALIEFGDGFLAVCPDCGWGTFIAKIPVLRPVEGEEAMYLGCYHCFAPFHVVGNFYVVVEQEAET
jgi:hypothetical protein